MMTKWKAPPVPRHVMQMMPIDSKGLVLVMHRSNKVRSARNVWSFPSGMHDIGETARACAGRELREEYGLKANMMNYLGLYENIAGDPEAKEQYHWVMTLVGVLVDDVTKAVNKEPDKHDKMEFLKLEELAHEDFTVKYPFHESFNTYWRSAFPRIIPLLETLHKDN